MRRVATFSALNSQSIAPRTTTGGTLLPPMPPCCIIRAMNKHLALGLFRIVNLVDSESRHRPVIAPNAVLGNRFNTGGGRKTIFAENRSISHTQIRQKSCTKPAKTRFDALFVSKRINCDNAIANPAIEIPFIARFEFY